jgi:hypothetical protein
MFQFRPRGKIPPPGTGRPELSYSGQNPDLRRQLAGPPRRIANVAVPAGSPVSTPGAASRAVYPRGRSSNNRPGISVTAFRTGHQMLSRSFAYCLDWAADEALIIANSEKSLVAAGQKVYDHTAGRAGVAYCRAGYTTAAQQVAEQDPTRPGPQPVE